MRINKSSGTYIVYPESISGTWTPKLRIGYNGEASTYYSNVGNYTRIGNLVVATGTISLAAKGSDAGFLNVAGLPFPTSFSNNLNSNALITGHSLVLASGNVEGYAPFGGTFIFLQTSNNGNPTTLANLTEANLRNDSDFNIQITYRTDSPIQPDFVVKGDSMASGDNYFGVIDCWSNLKKNYALENNGISGSLVQNISNYRDYRSFDKVILFTGFNNIKTSETAEDIIAKYNTVFSQLSGNVFCVSVPPLNHTLMETYFPDDAGVLNSKIQAVNTGILGICGASKYINAYDQFKDGSNECQAQYTIDGLHPSQAGYDWIITNILSKL